MSRKLVDCGLCGVGVDYIRLGLGCAYAGVEMVGV